MDDRLGTRRVWTSADRSKFIEYDTLDGGFDVYVQEEIYGEKEYLLVETFDDLNSAMIYVESLTC